MRTTNRGVVLDLGGSKDSGERFWLLKMLTLLLQIWRYPGTLPSKLKEICKRKEHLPILHFWYTFVLSYCRGRNGSVHVSCVGNACCVFVHVTFIWGGCMHRLMVLSMAVDGWIQVFLVIPASAGSKQASRWTSWAPTKNPQVYALKITFNEV